MRIDRSGPANEPGDGQVVRPARPTPDHPKAADGSRGEACAGHAPPEPPAVQSDSALRAERAAAYHALVDAVYRQYEIDHEPSLGKMLGSDGFHPNSLDRHNGFDPKG